MFKWNCFEHPKIRSKYFTISDFKSDFIWEEEKRKIFCTTGANLCIINFSKFQC